jgi:hypothetical protein
MTLVKSGLLAMVAVATVLIAGVALADGTPTRVGYRSHIFLVHRDGGIQRLTSGRTKNRAPTWCRSGRRVVAVGDRVQVRAARDGRLLYRLAAGSAFASSAAPSPDCRRFGVIPADDGLVLVDVHERRHVLVRHGVRRCGNLDLRPCPVWSTDARTLYYECGFNTCAVRAKAGSTPREVIDNVYDGPRISSDGEWLAFVRGSQDPKINGLWIARPDGSDQRHLLGGTSDPHEFGRVPGRHEVYAHGGRAGKRTVLISVSGHRRRIGSRFGGRLVTISPDRRVIAWISQRNAKGVEVLSGRIDDWHVRVLARFTSKGGLTEIDTLEWSPNGSELLVEPHRHIGD